jgi:choline dehydrogenase-like flavoprotein
MSGEVQVRPSATGIATVAFARPRREVILTAGAVGSPEILPRSGIGSVAHLKEVGIDPVLDLPELGSTVPNSAAGVGRPERWEPPRQIVDNILFILIDPAEATGDASTLLTDLRKKIGAVPDMAKAMADSPAVRKGWTEFSGALAGGNLSSGDRERIALATAEYNRCASNTS